MSDILAMMPGGNKLKGMTVDEKQLERTRAIVKSMTREERSEPLRSLMPHAGDGSAQAAERRCRM